MTFADKLNTEMCEISTGGVGLGLRIFKTSRRASRAASEGKPLDAGTALGEAASARL